ncbi:hypothetical protein [Vibrio owensii]|uniref:hypothetical protein n=1 Tax=Vibrio owensii TaxID=696485 RepID=UPI0018F11AF7|nr:hypothetical protein [Vibrio owensii]
MKELTTDLSKELINDCIQAANQWSSLMTPYSMRAYVRAVFAFIEGNNSNLQQLCLLSNERGFISLSEKQVKLFTHRTERGKPRQTPLLENTKNTIKILCESHNITNPVSFDGKGWEGLVKAISIRNRLTHPKSTKDLCLTREDMQCIESTCEFYRDATVSIVSSITPAN